MIEIGRGGDSKRLSHNRFSLYLFDINRSINSPSNTNTCQE
jgi:hypothetical protein